MGDLESALAAREKSWPNRDGTYDNLMNALQDFTEDLKNNSNPAAVSEERMHYY